MRPTVVTSATYPPMRARISHAKVYGGLCHVSGIVGREPATGKVIPGGVGPQTRQVMENLRDVLTAAGTTMDRVLKTNCFLSDIGRFEEFNRVWEEFFPDEPPARFCIQVGLGPPFEVEIDAVAAMP